MEEEVCRVHQLLAEFLGTEGADEFKAAELQGLAQAGYTSARRFRSATRDGLGQAGLLPASIDAILAAAAAAGPGSAAIAGAVASSSISPASLAGLFQGLAIGSAGGELVFKAEFRLLDAPYHASLITAEAIAKGVRGSMCVESNSSIRFKLIYDRQDFLEAFVQDMVMTPPSTEVGGTVRPQVVNVVGSSDRSDVNAFSKDKVFHQDFLRREQQAAYLAEIRLSTPSGLGRGSDREVLSAASRSSHEEE